MDGGQSSAIFEDVFWPNTHYFLGSQIPNCQTNKQAASLLPVSWHFHPLRFTFYKERPHFLPEEYIVCVWACYFACVCVCV